MFSVGKMVDGKAEFYRPHGYKYPGNPVPAFEKEKDARKLLKDAHANGFNDCIILIYDRDESIWKECN